MAVSKHDLAERVADKMVAMNPWPIDPVDLRSSCLTLFDVLAEEGFVVVDRRSVEQAIASVELSKPVSEALKKAMLEAANGREVDDE